MKLKERFVIRTEAHILVGRTGRCAETDVPLTVPAVRVIRDVSSLLKLYTINGMLR